MQLHVARRRGNDGREIVCVRVDEIDVERHHGRVSAENHDGGGAVFRVVLPKSLAHVPV